MNDDILLQQNVTEPMSVPVSKIQVEKEQPVSLAQTSAESSVDVQEDSQEEEVINSPVAKAEVAEELAEKEAHISQAQPMELAQVDNGEQVTEELTEEGK